MTTTRTSGMLRNMRTAILIVALLCFALAPAAAQAGQEGIYLSDSVYFTLDKARLSEGSDDSILRFAVKLHNGGNTSVDYNLYGIRVTDDEGFGYAAQLGGTQSARVQPGKDQEFAYESRVLKGLKPEKLRVTVFTWSYGSGIAMTDLGSFSVANAMQASSETVQEAVVPLSPMDSSLPADSRVAFRIGSEYTVYEDGEWNIYADLIADNLGDTGATLPAGLKMRLENAGGQTMTATAIDGADKSLLPGKPQRVAVRAGIPGSDSAQGWSLQFYYMNGDKAAVLDSLELGAGTVSPVTAIGESRPLTDSQGQEIVSLQVLSAIVSQSEDGQWIRTRISASNNGSRVVAVPSLSAKYQSAAGGVTVAATDSDTHAAYLSQGETETFSFSALLPKGMTAEELQLALFETRNATGSTSGSSASGNTGNAASGNSSASSSAVGGSSGSSSTGAASGNKVPVLLAGLGKAEIYNQGTGTDYSLGDRIELPLDKKLDAAITELKLYDNENYGFKTAVAKLKLTNLDNSAFALPGLSLDIVRENGLVYTGTRQANVISQLATNSSYMVSYSFIIPEAEEGQTVALRLYNGTDSIPLNSVRLGIEPENTADDVWDAYPYKITVNSGDLLVGQLGTTFSYTLNFNVALERRDQIVTDASVSKLQFEIEDSSGLVLSTQTLPFQGTTKLLEGDNSITFTNLKLNQFNSTNYVNVYEVVDTPNGIVKRKLGEIR
ncbi:hypothetical protein FE783_24655 [Paenibacillus mesophilus]|uniref:hypothetical protein n=1 Tax=Paenibacillus mesophilus TaxID=2582849 RepID=UPI00110F288E|nr:hypothetical protein [Paenibacillus mesophilus]TMV46834.1 hypothetical protein FE783_24655 [Paenibacillus mesophilus]